MKYVLAAACIVLTTVSHADPIFPVPSPHAEDTSWRLLTISRNGDVSILRGITQDECEFARARVLGRPATTEEKLHATNQAIEAENALITKQAAWTAWVAEHHCRENTWTMWPQPEKSYVSSDGACVRGDDVWPNSGLYFSSAEPKSSVTHAECFQ